MITRIIRWILTLLLIAAVYREAGVWTAAAIALLTIYAETSGYFLARLMVMFYGIAELMAKEDKEP